jgi:enamine deaminase RidA (YjgF/YER057c/UK114 family)
VAPRFVLLAGDASYDPKNYLGNGDTDLVPTKLIDTRHMEAASDDWFVDLDGDYLPEMAVARLPARTTMEATSMIAKIVAYEMAPSVAESVLIASDRDDGFDFESLADRLRQLIPEQIKTYAVRRSGAEDATVKAELISAINEGQKLVNYYGHGSANSWRGSILTNEDALALANGGRLSVFVLMTCLNGYFDDPSADSLAESLMKAGDGGAISVWASSAMCDPSPQRALNESFYRELFGGGRLTIGEAAQRAKMAVGDNDVRRTWILFGDPSMTLK